MVLCTVPGGCVVTQGASETAASTDVGNNLRDVAGQSWCVHGRHPPGLEAAKAVSDMQRNTASQDAKNAGPVEPGSAQRPRPWSPTTVLSVLCMHCCRPRGAQRRSGEDTVPAYGVAHKHCVNMVHLAARGAVLCSVDRHRQLCSAKASVDRVWKGENAPKREVSRLLGRK